jgi:pyruvate formate lyase activating enzyme
VPWEYFENVIPYTDLFLYDIKAFDPQVHKECTGVENGRILDNFRKLMQAGCNVLVRIPYIPGYNDGELEGIAQFLAEFPQVKAELLPYHSLGVSKARHIGGRQERFEAPPPERVEAIRELFEESGLRAEISGIGRE